MLECCLENDISLHEVKSREVFKVTLIIYPLSMIIQVVIK